VSKHSLDSKRLAGFIPDQAGLWRAGAAPEGAALIEPASPAGELFFLNSGEVHVYQPSRNEDRLIDVLGPGDLFNLAVLANSATCGIRAVAVTDVAFHKIAIDRLYPWLHDHPAAADEILRHVAGRLQIAQEESAALAYDTCQGRVLAALKRYGNSAAATRHNSRVILRFTHQQLAQAVGSSRETVSLCLADLRRQNILQTQRSQLSFDPRALEQFERHWRRKSGAAGDAR
jgi:CRP-like cAMP-binding protein